MLKIVRHGAALLASGLLLMACSQNDPLAVTSVPQETPPGAPAPTAEAQATTPATAPPPAAEALPPPESLSVAELHQRLDPFTPSVEGCTLPCYNGLTPAGASLADVLAFYSRLGIGPADLIPGDYDAVQDGTGRVGAWLTKTSDAGQAAAQGLDAPLVDVSVEDDAVQYLYIGWQYLPPYLTPARVLGALGQPDELLLAFVAGETPAVYSLRFFYDEPRAGFAFYGTAQGDASQPTLCFTPEAVERAFMGLFAPDAPPMEGLAYNQYLLPVADALSLSTDQFSAQVAGGGCITLTAEQAAQWQGLGE